MSEIRVSDEAVRDLREELERRAAFASYYASRVDELWRDVYTNGKHGRTLRQEVADLKSSLARIEESLNELRSSAQDRALSDAREDGESEGRAKLVAQLSASALSALKFMKPLFQTTLSLLVLIVSVGVLGVPVETALSILRSLLGGG